MTAIMSYGIPPDVIPFTQAQKIKTKNHLEYLAMRATAEKMQAQLPGRFTPEQLICIPLRKDVLLGKGRPIQFSSGNQALGSIVDGYYDQYHKESSKLEKTALASDIVRMVQANGVRFLSKDNGVWMEVPHDVAREKVSHMFRHQKQKKNTEQTGTVRADREEVPVLADASDEPAKKLRSS